MFKTLLFAGLLMPLAVQACPRTCSESSDCSGCGGCTYEPWHNWNTGTCMDSLSPDKKSKVKLLADDEYIKDGKVHKKNGH